LTRQLIVLCRRLLAVGHPKRDECDMPRLIRARNAATDVANTDKECLFSTAARRSWVEPALAPLPF
jgi:hypothetical protein